VLADEDELHKFIRATTASAATRSTRWPRTKDAAADLAAATRAGDDEIEQAQEASVIKLVNDLLIEAINERATDVHIEPYEDELAVRYRIDGVLQRANVPAHDQPVRGGDHQPAEDHGEPEHRREAQAPGRADHVQHRNKDGKIEEFDLRVSVIPMLFGEGVVLRVLNKSAVLMSLDDLGMPGT
jgi:type II secretory ATPase GspE/PulE/Tfp pilus assembly ATPase PilB-like protein